MQVFMEHIRQSGQQITEKLDKTLIDHHIAELDFQISRPALDAVITPSGVSAGRIPVARPLTSWWTTPTIGKNVKTEILDVAKDDLCADFEDAPELIQSGLYWLPIPQYDTPGGEPIGSVTL